MEPLAVNLEFENLNGFSDLLKKAQSDVEALQADVEAIKNFKINVIQK